MTAQPNKQIILVLSDKGGTGKSLFSRGLADYLIRKQVNDQVLLVDGDGEVGQLLQFYNDFGVISAQIINAEKRDQFIDILESDKDLIIVDLPAASISDLEALDDEIGFFDLVQAHGYKLILCNVLSPFKASIRSVKAMIDLAGNKANYVVVKNRFFGSDEDFHLYHSGKGKEAMKKHDGLEIELPAIATGVLAEIDSRNLPFHSAMLDKQLKLAYRCRVNRWLHTFDQQLDKLVLLVTQGMEHE